MSVASTVATVPAPSASIAQPRESATDVAGLGAVCAYITRGYAAVGAPGSNEPTTAPTTRDELQARGGSLLEYAGWLRDQAGALDQLVEDAPLDQRENEAKAVVAVDALIRLLEDYGTRLAAVEDDGEATTALMSAASDEFLTAYYTICMGDYGDEFADEIRDENQIMINLTTTDGVGCRSPEMRSDWMGRARVNVIVCKTASSEFRVAVFDDADALAEGLKASCLKRRAAGEFGADEAARGSNWVAYSDGNPEATNAELAEQLGGTVFDPLADSVCTAELAWDKGTPALNAKFCPLWAKFPEIPPFSDSPFAMRDDAHDWSDAWHDHRATIRDELNPQFLNAPDPMVYDDYGRLIQQLGDASSAVFAYSAAIMSKVQHVAPLEDVQAAATKSIEEDIEPAFAAFDLRCANMR